MAYFDKDYIQFFKELAANNNREWFQDNKKRYERSVKKPFEVLVTDVIEATRKIDKNINPPLKDTLFRINRDVRFSPNKAPYNLHKSAIISPKGRKDNEYPGFYLQINAETLWLGGGAYMLNKEQLQDMRYSLIDEPGKLQKLLEAKDFKSAYGELKGELYKVLPKEFKEQAEQEPLLFHKQFYYMTELSSDLILKEDLLNRIIDHFKAGKAVNDYLIKAMYH